MKRQTRSSTKATRTESTPGTQSFQEMSREQRNLLAKRFDLLARYKGVSASLREAQADIAKVDAELIRLGCSCSLVLW